MGKGIGREVNRVVCGRFGGRIGIERTVDVTLETGVSTRLPIAWIELGVDEGGKKWTLYDRPAPGGL